MEKLFLVSLVLPASHWNCCDNMSQDMSTVTGATTTAPKSKCSPEQCSAARGSTENNSHSLKVSCTQVEGAGGRTAAHWRGCQWPRAVGLSFSAQSDLDYLSSSYLSHLKWEEKFLQWECLWGAKGRETLPGRTSRAGERQGLRRTDVSSAWEAAVWGNSGVGCCWARSLGFGMKLEASSTIVEGARIKGFKRSLWEKVSQQGMLVASKGINHWSISLPCP